MAALNALAQAVAECDQFRAVGRERDPIHFWVLAGEPEDVVQDRIRDVLDGPGLAVVERGELFHQPRIVELVVAARDARTAPSTPRACVQERRAGDPTPPSPPPRPPSRGPRDHNRPRTPA